MGRDGMAYKEHGRDSNPCLWDVTPKPVCMNTIFHSAQNHNCTKIWGYYVSICNIASSTHISQCLLSHKAHWPFLIPLEYYTIRCWARRKKKIKVGWSRKQDTPAFPTPGSSLQSTVYTLIFLFKSLEVPLALDCVKDNTLFPTPGTHCDGDIFIPWT